VDSVWYDHEIILNNGDEATVFKRLMKVKRQKMFTDLWDKMESDYWAAPNATTMEGGNTNGADPYSLLCFVTGDGLAVPSTTNSHTSTTGTWTTIETLNPTTYTNWANQYSTYDSSDIDANLEDALNEMWIKVQFEAPDERRQDGHGRRGLSKIMITTNLEGIRPCCGWSRTTPANSQPGRRPGLGERARSRSTGCRSSTSRAARQHRDLPDRQAEVLLLELQPHPAGLPQEAVPAGQELRGHDRQPMANVEYRDTWRNTCARTAASRAGPGRLVVLTRVNPREPPDRGRAVLKNHGGPPPDR
jgi:hypothetical protein